ncbi:MAG: NERD domain-containing protein [Candidatus Aenigmarchaeota archaeon]|nr:NERD domain-containing protein [Candidatus Aenigmarchaeota archaeon]
MVRVYGESDAEKEFLEYLNGNMLESKLTSLDDYQNFQRYPQKRKTGIIKTFDCMVETSKAEQTRCYNRNKSILKDLKIINSRIFYKEKGVNKYYGKLREKIEGELSLLIERKRGLESDFESNNIKITSLKSDIQTLYSTKKSTLYNIDQDIRKLSYLNNDNRFKKIRQGAFGERNVIFHILNVYEKDKRYHLINGFDINLLGKAINFHDHTLVENKIDHILLCPYGLYILETKAWKNYSNAGVEKIIKQLEKIRKVFQETFSEKINQKFVNIFLICTEKHILIDDNKHFKSIKLEDLQKEIENNKEVFSKDEITLILNTFLPYLTSNHITKVGKANIKIKALFVKTKKFIKSKFSKT